MVYKKTQGRQVFIRPNGMPDLSGFSALGDSLNKLSDVTKAIGDDQVKQEFNDMLIQAELDGRTAGVRRGENGELLPLVDTTYASAMKAYGTRSQKSLQEAFKQSAVNSYLAQLAIDAKNNSGEMLLLNPEDPDVLVGGMKGELEKLQVELEPNLFELAKIKVEEEYGVNIFKARAGRIKKVREDAIGTASERLIDITDKLTTLAVVGPGSAPPEAKSHEDAIAALQQEREELYDVLRLNGKSINDVEAMRQASHTQVLLGGAKAQVEKIYMMPEKMGGGYENALRFIGDFEAATRESNLDKDSRFTFSEQNLVSLSKSMTAYLKKMKERDDAGKVATTQAQNDRKDKEVIEILTTNPEDLISEEEIVDLISSGDISEGGGAVLLRALAARQTGIQKSINDAKTDVKKENANIFRGHLNNAKMALAKNDLKGAEGFLLQAQGMRKAVTEETFGPYSTVLSNLVKTRIKQKSVPFTIAIEEATLTSGPNAFKIHPNDLLGIMKQAATDGIVDVEGGPTTKYLTGKYNSYVAAYKKHVEKEDEKIRAMAAAEKGVATPKQKETVRNEVSANLIADENGNIFDHSDSLIAEQNFKKVVKFAREYKMLPTEAQQLLTEGFTAAASEESFVTSLNLHNVILFELQSDIAKNTNTTIGQAGTIAKHILHQSGIDSYDVWVATQLGYDKYREHKANMINSIKSNRTEANLSNLGKVLDDTRPEWLDAYSQYSVMGMIGHWVFGGDGDKLDEIHHGIDAIERNQVSGDLSLSDAMINNDNLATLFEDMVRNKLTAYNMDESEQNVINAAQSVMHELSNKLGLDVDSDGDVKLVLNPWFGKVASSIPSAAQDALVEDPRYGGGIKGAYFREVERQVLNPLNPIDDRIRKEIENENGKFEVISKDDRFGQGQTILWVDEDGQRTPVLEDFTYNFELSIDNAMMRAAMNRLQNTSLKHFFKYVSSARPVALKAFQESILADLREDSDFIDSSTFSGVDGKKRYLGIVEKFHKFMREDAVPFIVMTYPFGSMEGDTGTRYDQKVDDNDVKILRLFLNNQLRSMTSDEVNMTTESTFNEYLKNIDKLENNNISNMSMKRLLESDLLKK